MTLYPKAGVNKPHGPGSTLAGRIHRPTAAYDAAVLADNPSVYWRLDEATGTTATDLSGNGRDGTISGTFTLDQTGPSPALPVSLDVVSGGKVVAAGYIPHANGSTRTFEGWSRREGVAGNATLVGSESGGGAGCAVYLGTGGTAQEARMTCQTRITPTDGSNQTFETAWTAGVNNWVYWAIVIREAADTCEAYVHGVTEGSKAITQSYDATPGELSIGTVSSNAYPWNGKIAGFAAYESELSAARILTHYNAGKP